MGSRAFAEDETGRFMTGLVRTLESLILAQD
ncbi:MAG: hypothetical protein AVDCRST_MAG93-6063, partial [uncultured Chloroflexia bacterium]